MGTPRTSSTEASRRRTFRLRGLVVLLAIVGIVAGTLSGAARGAGTPAYVIEDGIAVPSFDGKVIMTTLMLPTEASPSNPVPVVLNTHGFGAYAHRAYTPGGMQPMLLDNGYAVMTFDSRGYGESGGLSNMNSPSYEVKDVKALVAYLATRPEILRDGPGDPRVGFIGSSYAATIQLNAASFDRRIDAIIPQHASADMGIDLAPDDVFKQRWQLSLDGSTRFAPEVHTMADELQTQGMLSSATKTWLSEKATTRYSSNIRTPTLIMQGTTDTLFPLQDGIANFLNIKAAGAPVKMIAYCEGHTACPYPGGASGDPGGSGGSEDLWIKRLLAWLDKHVKKKSVATGPEFEWQSQYGYYRGASTYPLPGGVIRKSPTSSVSLVGPGASGGDTLVGGLPAPPPEFTAKTAARVHVYGPVTTSTAVVGLPSVRVEGTARGIGVPIAFFELIEVAPEGSLRSVDRQVFPARMARGPIDESVSLNAVAWILKPGYSLQLEVTTGSGFYRSYGTASYSLDLELTTSIPTAPLD